MSQGHILPEGWLGRFTLVYIGLYQMNLKTILV